MRDSDSGWAEFGKLFVGGFAFIACLLFDGYVLFMLWRWHVTPAFGVDAPRWSLCVGLCFVFGFACRGLPPKGTEMDYAETILRGYARSATYLAVGFAFSWFV